MNILLIAYFVFLFGFLAAIAAIVYHLVKFQLNRATTILTTTLFLAGAGILLLVNIIIASQIKWGRYEIDIF